MSKQSLLKVNSILVITASAYFPLRLARAQLCWTWSFSKAAARSSTICSPAFVWQPQESMNSMTTLLWQPAAGFSCLHWHHWLFSLSSKVSQSPPVKCIRTAWSYGPQGCASFLLQDEAVWIIKKLVFSRLYYTTAFINVVVCSLWTSSRPAPYGHPVYHNRAPILCPVSLALNSEDKKLLKVCLMPKKTPTKNVPTFY